MNNNQWDDDEDDREVNGIIDLSGNGQPQGGDQDDEIYSDDGSSTASIPPEHIDFSLTYALQTFVATVEGQASVIKGDSLVLLDDANSYWWLVRVLKTEDVGYIPAENIETPYERLARLNKHRNVDLASATQEEVNQPPALTRLAAQKSSTRQASFSLPTPPSPPLNPRHVFFAPPTYVDHPGVTWSESGTSEEGSSDEEGEEGEEGERVEDEVSGRRDEEGMEVEREMGEDDGVGWEDGAVERERAEKGIGAERQQQQQQQQQQQAQLGYGQQGQQYQPRDGNQSQETYGQPSTQQIQQPDLAARSPQQTLRSSPSKEGLLDPAEMMDAEPRKISLTPAVARNSIGVYSPLIASATSPGAGGYQQQQQSAPQQQQQQQLRNVSSASSNFTNVSIESRSTPESPGGDEEESNGGRKIKKSKDKKEDKKGKKDKASGGEDSATDDQLRKRKSSGGGVFSGLFKKKEKKDKGVQGGKGIEGQATRRPSYGNDSDSFATGRSSEDSLGIGMGHQDSPGSMTTPAHPSPSVAQQSGMTSREYGDSPGSVLSGGSSMATSSSVSPHALRLQQIDQKQQQLYQQYMARSPPSPLADPARSYGLQAAATVAVSSAAQRLVAATQSNGRPGSIVLQPNPAAPGPLLNVLRVFAGDYVESESTFKTVLLSESTLAKDLVKQAFQRFRLTAEKEDGTDLDEYFLTIKEIDGEELALEPQMKPLEAFNEMAKRIGEEDAAYRSATVKRSSVGSVSSVSSNLSLNPAIARLGMSDFSDDSAVKLFLNRRRPGQAVTGGFSSYGSMDETNLVKNGVPTMQVHKAPDEVLGAQMTSPVEDAYNQASRGLTVNTGRSSPERLSSPSSRFTMQIMIYPDDLPDGMVFDTQTEAIIPRAVLRERMHSGPVPSSPSMQAAERRKLFVMPKNTTVAEAVEAGLERFGIAEGVVDGGDDVEDKASNRRSLQKVRYGLAVLSSGSEQLLHASHKIIEAYSTPPMFKAVERTTSEMRRRSREMSQQAANPSDVLPTDPVFILRRMRAAVLVANRGSGVPLDDLALRQRRLSDVSTGRAPPATVSPTESSGPSRQEIIAAQRAASRANQKAILSAQANGHEGVDVVMADRSTIRSSRLLTGEGEQQYRYSYISGEGETYDISQLIEDELRPSESEDTLEVLSPPDMSRKGTDTSVYHSARSTPAAFTDSAYSPLEQAGARLSSNSMIDLLHGALKANDGEDSEIANRLDRVVSMVKRGSVQQAEIPRTLSVDTGSRPSSRNQEYPPQNRVTSGYSALGRDVSLSPVLEDIPSSIRRDVEAASSVSRSSSRALSSPTYETSLRSSSRQSNVTARLPPRGHRQQPSIASIISDFSAAETETGGLHTPQTALTSMNPTPPNVLHPAGRSNASTNSPSPRQPVKYKDDFGMKNMMAVINARARLAKPPVQPKKKLDEVERLFFGEQVDLARVHPEVRKAYEPIQRKLDDADRELDELLARLVAGDGGGQK